MMLPRDLGEFRINALLVIISAGLWAFFWFLNAWLFAWLHYTDGISLIYFPAGIRLGIVLVFGIWGAIGIALSNPILFVSEFGARPLAEIVIDSLIAGFVPFLAARFCERVLHIGTSLTNLRAVHLPVLALAVSIATPLAFNLMFIVFGLQPVQDLWRNLSAMALGDFLGCMIALVVIKVVLLLRRKIRRLQRQS